MFERSRHFKQLREAIYAHEKDKTYETACTIVELSEFCTTQYGREATNKTVQLALRVLSKRK